MITDINFGDVIPYDYEITNIKTTGSLINEVSRERTEAGLKVEWIIPRLDSGQSALVEYALEKRMLRPLKMEGKKRVYFQQSVNNFSSNNGKVIQ